MVDHWIFPNPKYPGKVERAILVDLESREPLRDDQADALNLALSKMIEKRDYLNERIRIVTQRILLSGEAKVKEIGDDNS